MEVINGKLNEKQNKLLDKKKFLSNKYYDLYNEYLYEQDIKKAAFYGVKYISHLRVDTETSLQEFLLADISMQDIMYLLEQLTLNDLINMFPIIKEYDGKKYECKDYFSTMDYLKDKDMTIPLGEEIYSFLFEYYNNDIINFAVKQMLIIDKIRKLQNKQGLLEEFIQMADTKHEIHTYTLHKEEGYIYDNVTGKTMKIEKPKKKIPKYLKVVKNN